MVVLNSKPLKVGVYGHRYMPKCHLPLIIDQIDNKSGYETDETIFDRLFKVKKE